MYQDEHALLVPLLACGLLLITVIAGQLLVYGGHGDILLKLLLLRCWQWSQLLPAFENFDAKRRK